MATKTITGVGVGTTTITASFGGKTSSVSFTVNSIDATLTFSANSTTLTYDGSSKKLGTINYTGDSSNVYYLVKTSNSAPADSDSGWTLISSWTTINGASKTFDVYKTDAGSYYVFLKASAGTNYNSVAIKLGNSTAKDINRATGSSGSVSNPAAQNYKDGSSTAYTFTIGITGATGTVTYPSSITVTKDGSSVSGWTISGTTVTAPSGTGAGTYTVTGNITVAQSANYNAVSATSKSWTITVNKVSDASVSPIKNSGTLTYSTSSTNRLVTSTSTHGVSSYQLGYKLGSTATSDSQITWGTANTTTLDVPAGAQAGTYYIYKKWTADSNHSNNGTYTYVDTKEIGKATGSSGSVSNPAAQDYKDGNTTNYSFNIGISGATGTVTYPSSITVTKSGSSVSGWSISGSTVTVPYAQGAGEYTVTGSITVAATTNYNAVSATSKSWTITINKVSDASVTASLSSGTLTYAPSTSRTLASVTATHGVSSYQLGYRKGSAATSDGQITWGTANNSSISAIDAGNYYVYYKFSPDGNHSNTASYTQIGTTYRTINATTGSVGSVSNPAAQDYKDGNTTNYSFTLGMTGNTGTVTYPSSITVTNGGSSVSGWTISNGVVSVPYAQGAGEYTVTGNVTCAASSDGNYAAVTTGQSRSWTITISKKSDASVSVTINTASGNTYGSAYNLVVSGSSGSSSHGTSAAYIGYKLGEATADSQITWVSVGSALSLATSAQAGTYYIYKKWTADSNHSNNGTYTYVNTKVRGKATGSVGSVSNPAAQDYKDGNTTNYSFTLGMTGNTGTVTYPSSITVTNGGSSVSGWTISNGVVSVPYAQGAGEYTVTGNVTCAASTNYEAVTTGQSRSWTITINKKSDASVTVCPAGNAGSYNSAATLVASGYTANTSGSTSHGTSAAYIGYSLGQASKDSDITWVSVGSALSLAASANAGTYYIYKKWTADSNHSNNGTYTQVTTLTRSKITGSAGSVNNPAAQNYKEPNAAHTFTIGITGATGTVTYPSSITVTKGGSSVSGWTISGTTVTAPSGTGAGTYTVTGSITVAAATNYNAVSATSKSWTITVNKVSDASVSVTPGSSAGTYGSAATLVTAANSSSHGTSAAYVGYSLGQASKDSDITWVGVGSALSLATSASAGTYYIYKKWTADSNHSNNGTYTQVGEPLTRGKKTPSFDLASSGDVKYHNTASVTATTEVAGTVYWGTSTSAITSTKAISASTATTITSRTSLGTTTVYAYFVPTDTVNYTNVGSASSGYKTATAVIVKATDAKVTATRNTNDTSLVYNGSQRTLVTATGEGCTYYLGYKKGSAATADNQITWSSANASSLTAIDAGTYYVYYKFEPDSNHSNSATYTAVGGNTVTITKATATLPGTISGDSASYSNVAYHNTARATVSQDYVGGTLKFSTDSGSSWSNVTWYSGNLTANPSRTSLGTTSVIFKVFNTDGNYNDSAASGAITLTVYESTDARMEVTLVSTTLTYNGSSQTIASVDTSNSSKYEGIATYNIGYKKDSEATADSQVTWNSNNTTPLQVTDAGIYYVYYKFTSDSNHSNNKTYTKVGSVTINKQQGQLTYSTNPSVSLYCTTNAVVASSTDAAKTPTIASSYASSSTNTGAAITYSISKSGWTNNGTKIIIPAGTPAGTYEITVSAHVAATSNYGERTVPNDLTVTITEVVLNSIVMELTSNTVAYGSSTTVSSVIATYSNNKTKDVKEDAEYTSNPTGIVTITTTE